MSKLIVAAMLCVGSLSFASASAPKTKALDCCANCASCACCASGCCEGTCSCADCSACCK